MRFRFCGDLDCPDWILSEVAIMSQLDVSDFNDILLIVQNLFMKQSPIQIQRQVQNHNLNTDKPVDGVQGVRAAIYFILLNSAKYNLDATSLQQEIEQLGLPTISAKAVSKAYNQIKDKLRIALFNDNQSNRINRVINTNFSINNIIASSSSSPSSLDGNDQSDHVQKFASIFINTEKYNENETTITNTSFQISEIKLDAMIYELEKCKEMAKAMNPYMESSNIVE